MTDKEIVDAIRADDKSIINKVFYDKSSTYYTVLSKIVTDKKDIIAKGLGYKDPSKYTMDVTIHIRDLIFFLQRYNCRKLNQFEYKTTLSAWIYKEAARYYQYYGDDILIQKILKGDNESVEELEAKIKCSKVFSKGKYTKDVKNNVVELVIEDLIKDDWHSLKTYRCESSLDTWLYQLISHKIYYVLTDKSNRIPIVYKDQITEYKIQRETEINEKHERKILDWIGDIKIYINNILDDKDKKLAELYIDGFIKNGKPYTYKELAEMMNDKRSAGAIGTQLCRLKKKIKTDATKAKRLHITGK